jgi:preprotein translocase subunit SecY
MTTIGSGQKFNRRKEKNIFVRIFTNKNVLLSLFLTAFLLIIFHIGSIIPLPGIKIKAGAANASDFTSMLNLLAGGGLSRMSLFAVGVGPYITAQIITQLLSSDLIPAMTRMAKSGERGKKQLEIITRVLTLPFCIAQSYAIIALLLNSNGGDSGNITIFGQTSLSELTFKEIITLIIIFAAGTYISIFFGDMITKRGIGNGVTLLILSGIVGSLFSNFNVA